jgi:CRISPR-associated protein Cmr3
VTFDNRRIITDLPGNLSSPWHRSEKVLTGPQGFLSTEEMKTYLSGNAPGKVKPDSELYKVEDRTGIRKNRSRRSVEDGGLYTVSYFRLKRGIGFSFDVTGTGMLLQEGILRLGGDHRSAMYSRAEWRDPTGEDVKAKIIEDKRFKLALTTPAIFKNGWLPGGIDSNSMEGTINGVQVRLLGACIGKPVGIGGFDMVKRLPKPMKKAVPAGSVYYFELKGDTGNIFDNLHLQSISDDKSQEGFGISVIGGI